MAGCLSSRFLARTVVGAVLAVLVLWPLASGPFGLHLGSIVAVYALGVVGLDLVVGRAGMLHVGYGVFFGLGAYTVGTVAQSWTVPLAPVILLGVVIAAGGAALVALVVSQVSGYVFALVTLATAAVFESLLRALPGFGGTSGLGGISRDLVGTGEVDSRILFLVLAATTLGAIVLYGNLRSSRVGRAIEALRVVPTIAEASGVDLARLRFTVLVLSGAIGGLTGGLFAVTVQYVSPELFGILASVNFLVMSVLGGRGVAWGAIPGAMLVRGLPQAFQRLGDWQLVAVGLATGLVVIWARRGIAGSISDAWRRRTATPRPAPEPADALGSVRASGPMPDPGSPTSVALTIENVTVRFGGLVALDRVSLELRPSSVTALVGPNGSGKTTLVNAIAGRVRPESGTIRLGVQELIAVPPAARVRMGVTRTFQLVSLCDSLSVVENVMLGGHTLGRAGVLRGTLPCTTRAEERALRGQALARLHDLGVDGLAGASPSTLSSGQRRLVEIGRCLMTNAGVVLLDEPAAGLNETERDQLATVIRTLARSGRAVLLIEHDMSFVMALADRIVVLSDGAVLTEGEPRTVRADPRVIEAYWGQEVPA